MMDAPAPVALSAMPARQKPPRSATRIPRLLCLLAERPDGATLSQLSEASATPKSSLLALLRALTQSGFLQLRGGLYVIGPESVKLASSIVSHRRFPDVALPVVDALCDATGESALLAQLAGDAPAAVYVYAAHSKNALRFMADIGSREPLHSSAVGRVLLAFQPKEWREDFLRMAKLEPVTAQTVRTKSALRRIVEAVRRDKVATSLEETIEGVAGIAAPIFDKAGAVIAGVVIGAPVGRIRPRIPLVERMVKGAGEEISRLMGHAPGGARAG
jgi:DNA-binding IclR family transcriptional regulator